MPGDDQRHVLAVLEDLQRQIGDLQRQVGELVRAELAKAKGRKRRRRATVYDPPRDLPGPKPTPADVARAKRLWRRGGR